MKVKVLKTETFSNAPLGSAPLYYFDSRQFYVYGGYEPLVIQWSDQADFNDWAPITVQG